MCGALLLKKTTAKYHSFLTKISVAQKNLKLLPIFKIHADSRSTCKSKIYFPPAMVFEQLLQFHTLFKNVYNDTIIFFIKNRHGILNFNLVPYRGVQAKGDICLCAHQSSVSISNIIRREHAFSLSAHRTSEKCNFLI